MRVHVISDMEGVGGIVNGSQTNAGEPLYEEGRKLYTEEINAAVRGAKSPPAPPRSCVMDHHGAGKGLTFNSLVADLLDPACEYVVQQDWTEYTGFLEEGCDACLLVGMHAMAGSRPASWPHGLGPRLQNLWFNGTLVGETGINAALCGHAGLPRAARHRRRRRLRRGDRPPRRRLTTVVVEAGIGPTAARMILRRCAAASSSRTELGGRSAT